MSGRVAGLHWSPSQVSGQKRSSLRGVHVNLSGQKSGLGPKILKILSGPATGLPAYYQGSSRIPGAKGHNTSDRCPAIVNHIDAWSYLAKKTMHSGGGPRERQDNDFSERWEFWDRWVFKLPSVSAVGDDFGPDTILTSRAGDTRGFSWYTMSES
ncbi:hypothetical protein BV22DRAFT_1046791 [Leucogyrophana mollusca]|uniref:Uncharacterized protein n=1 Tax=Leucogyrophana mollusca TaxID=85980 RepID=A0ACB8BIW7_9AGAM|nr:hypothetical protein BV22DRAFT_1046791 [Leucogyrophana mollusca]